MAYKNYIKKPVSKTMSLLSTFAEFTQCEARQIVFFFFLESHDDSETILSVL